MSDGYRSRVAESAPRVREEIRRAAAAAGRDPSHVRLVAVSKGHPLEAVEAALEAGLTDLGENRVEELEAKLARVGSRARWHFIGHLQSRKAARALAADLIHSVDSLRLAERLARAAEAAARDSVPVLLQVNTSGEETKGGIPWENAEAEIRAVLELGPLQAQGLMTMAPLTDDETIVRDAFRRLRQLSERLRAAGAPLGPELSMGMTNDLAVAVEEGSTLVRIGTALFGERETQA